MLPLLATLLLGLAPPVPGPPGPENVLLIVVDDVGVDLVGAYGLGLGERRTPQLDALAERGMRFTNAWANPTCSISRATILTGQYAFRTGVSEVRTEGAWGLRTDVATLPDLLGKGWQRVALGKWHLATPDQGPGHPLDCGFDVYQGSLFNLHENQEAGNYFRWWKTRADGDGVRGERVETYATTDTVDDALDWIERLREPWFLYVSFNAVHTPAHLPPSELHTRQGLGAASAEEAKELGYLLAMMEALDTELGRLMAAVPEDTTVIFVGDNGTARYGAQGPLEARHMKTSIYEGGIRVPLIVSGPRVARPGSACGALVNTTDIVATVAEIAGVEPELQDAVGFLDCLADPGFPGGREFAYAELFRPGGPDGRAGWDRHTQAVRDARYKLIRRTRFEPRGQNPSVREELYDLQQDPFETTDLSGKARSDAVLGKARRRLRVELQRIDASAGR